MNDNMQTNDAIRVQSPYYQAGTPNQMTSPYNASTGSGPSPHPIGTPGLNTSPCSGIDVQRTMGATPGHNPGYIQGPTVLPGPGQPPTMYGAPPGATYGSTDESNSVQTVPSGMHSQYPVANPVMSPVSHNMPNTIAHGRPSSANCQPSLAAVKPGTYPAPPAQHHISNSTPGDVYNMTRPCSVGSTEVPSPQTNTSLSQIDMGNCVTAPGYPPGLPPGAPMETGNGHMMTRPSSQGQHGMYPSNTAPVQQNYCIPASDGSQHIMNGLPNTTSMVPSSHGGAGNAYSMQVPPSQQQTPGPTGANTNVYGIPNHHASAHQGYYNLPNQMNATGMAPNVGTGGTTAPNTNSVDVSHVGLPTPMANGGGTPYSSIMPHQRLPHENSQMTASSGMHHHPVPGQPPMPSQYGAHHPGAPVPQPYGTTTQGRFTVPPQPHMKPEITCSQSTTLPPSPATPSMDGAKESPVPSVGTLGQEASLLNHTAPSNTVTTVHSSKKSVNNTSNTTPQDRFDGLSVDEVSKKSLPDFLRDGLDIIIIGFNPSLSAAHAGHYYAGPGNHFWSCVTESGLAKPGMTYLDDSKLPECGIGLTHMCKRPTKGAADLTREEIKEGIRSLTEKLKRFRPLIACFNGKGIYENFIDNKNFYMGKQPDAVAGTNIALFVMPSSSARCAQLPRPADKLPFYNALRHLRDYLKGRIPRLEEVRLIFKDYSEVKAFANATENGNRSSMTTSSKRKRKRGSSAKSEDVTSSVTTVSTVVPSAAALGHPYPPHPHHPHARYLAHHPALPAPPPPPHYPGHYPGPAPAQPHMMPRFHHPQQMAAHPLPAISSLGQPPAGPYYHNSMPPHHMPGPPAFQPQMTYGHPHVAHPVSAHMPSPQQSFYFPPYQIAPPGHSTGSDYGMGTASSSNGVNSLDDLSLSEFLASSPSDSGGNNAPGSAVDAMATSMGPLVPASQSYFGSEVADNPTYTPL